MKKIMTVIVAVMFLIVGSTLVFAEKAPQKVIDLANSKLAGLGTDPVIVKAVNLAPTRARRVINGRRFDDQQTDAAPGECFIVGQDRLVHMKLVLVPEQRARAGLDDAVPGFDRAYVIGLKQFLESSHV